MARKKPTRTTTKTKSDDDETKRFPNGISATVLAIQHYWKSLTIGGPDRMTPGQFCDSGFRDVYRNVIDKYRGIRKRPHPDEGDGLAKAIHKLTNGTTDLEFFHLRSFAEFVGLPTGIFLLFTQMVSDERRALDDRTPATQMKEELLCLIRATKAVMVDAENYITEHPDLERIFTHVYDTDGQKYMAKADVLKVWSDAFARSKGGELTH